MFTYPIGMLAEIDESPTGIIVAWLGGYFTNSNNGGYTKVLAGVQSIAEINNYLESLGGLYRVCDGSAPNDPASPIWNTSGRYLPNLTDGRFLMGGTIIGIGDIGGNNNLPAVGTLGGSVNLSHSHQLTHDHSVLNHSHSVSNHSHTFGHTHNVTPSVSFGSQNIEFLGHRHIENFYISTSGSPHAHRIGYNSHYHEQQTRSSASPGGSTSTDDKGSTHGADRWTAGLSSGIFIGYNISILDYSAGTHIHYPSGYVGDSTSSWNGNSTNTLYPTSSMGIGGSAVSLSADSLNIDASISPGNTSVTTTQALNQSGDFGFSLNGSDFLFSGNPLENRPPYLSVFFLMRIK